MEASDGEGERADAVDRTGVGAAAGRGPSDPAAAVVAEPSPPGYAPPVPLKLSTTQRDRTLSGASITSRVMANRRGSPSC